MQDSRFGQPSGCPKGGSQGWLTSKILLAAFDLAVRHLGFVDHHAGTAGIGDFSNRKGTSEDILCHRCLPFLIVAADAHAIINGKARSMTPFHNHSDKLVINQTFFFEHLQDFRPEQLSQWLQTCPGHNMKDTAFTEQPVRSYRMNMRMPFGIIPESLDWSSPIPGYRLQFQGPSAEMKEGFSGHTGIIMTATCGCKEKKRNKQI